jgi:hypothetical protein
LAPLAALTFTTTGADGKGEFIEIWLVDRSGRFQVDSLTEGQL